MNTILSSQAASPSSQLSFNYGAALSLIKDSSLGQFFLFAFNFDNAITNVKLKHLAHEQTSNANVYLPADNSAFDRPMYTLARAESAKEISALTSEWLLNVLDKNAECDAKHLRKTARPVFKALTKYGPGSINLRGLKPTTVNGRHLAVILRATAVQQNRTIGWDEAIDVATQALESEGLSAADILSGLK